MNTRERNLEVVESFFASLEAMDCEKVIALFDENIHQIMPYSPEWFPSEFKGKEAMGKVFGGIVENFVSMKYERKLEPMFDESKVVAQFKGVIHMKNGQIYDNTYINIFTVKESKIVEIIEYFNPIILEKGFKS